MARNDREWQGMTGFRQQGGEGRRILCERSEARSACAPRFFFLHSEAQLALGLVVDQEKDTSSTQMNLGVLPYIVNFHKTKILGAGHAQQLILED